MVELQQVTKVPNHMQNNSSASKSWQLEEVSALFEKPFMDLVFEAQRVLRQHFPAGEVQVSTLKSIKTGACPEDCKYCPQSAHYQTDLEKEKLLNVEEVVKSAEAAKAAGATRFCMGAAWRGPHEKDMPVVTEMIGRVKALGLETCGTFGLLDDEKAQQLSEAGLDYYNHNLDSSEEFYGEIITTRNYEDRLQTLDHARESGMKLCCGGIIGMGESVEDRAKMLLTLANLPTPPESVPINQLIAIPGTPLEGQEQVDSFDFIRTIAVARIMLPGSFVRLSAGREEMSEEMQALCFFAGANSIFYGEKLLTADNPSENEDKALFKKLGLRFMQNADA